MRGIPKAKLQCYEGLAALRRFSWDQRRLSDLAEKAQDGAAF